MDDRGRALLRRWATDPGNYDEGRAYIAHCRRQGLEEFQVRIQTSGCFTALGTNAQGQREWQHRLTGMVMVEVPAGSFEMGAPPGLGDTTERPRHTVEFLRPFLIGKHPVKQGEWKAAMDGRNPSLFQGTSTSPVDDQGRVLDAQGHPWDDHPVEGIDWDTAVAFCEKVGLRLPTEAMWEYACRAGTTTRFHSGDTLEDLRRVAWFDLPPDDGHRACGLLEANAWGLHDVHGNVFEWVQDRWHTTYRGAPRNGLIAWDDNTGYNHPLWTDGSVEDLILAQAGALPIAAVEETAAPAEKRLVKYGLSVRLAPRPFAARPAEKPAGPDDGSTGTSGGAASPGASGPAWTSPTQTGMAEAGHPVQPPPPTTPPSGSVGRSVPVDRAEYGHYGTTEEDMFLGREGAGEIRAANPREGDVPARSAGTSPTPSLPKATPKTTPGSRSSSSGDRPNSRNRPGGSASPGNAPTRSSAAGVVSKPASPTLGRPPFDPRALDDPGYDWSGLEDPLVDVPLTVEEPTSAEAPPTICARPRRGRSHAPQLRCRRGEVSWDSGQGFGGDTAMVTWLLTTARQRSRNHSTSALGDQGFRATWS